MIKRDNKVRKSISMKGGDIVNKLDIVAQIGDMKEVEYRNMLAVTSMIEVLLEKKIITKEEIAEKAEELDKMAYPETDIPAK